MSQLFAATYESLPNLWRLGRGRHSEEAAAAPCGRNGDSTSVPQASLALGFLCCFSSPLCGGNIGACHPVLVVAFGG